jgi:hypothetical protein
MRAPFALLVLLFSTALLSLPRSPSEAAEPSTALSVRESGVRLYAQQDAETAPIGKLEKGESLFPLVEAVGPEIWYMVRTKAGQVGWVRGADVVISNETKDAFKEKESGSSTWSARTADGRIFSGTWSIAPSSTKSGASGAWTLSNANGTSVMRGTWSAEKHSTGWNGVWHAAVEGRDGELTGSWSAELPYVRNAPFAEMFEAAVKASLHGLWTGASESGSWSIRYVKPQ